MISINLDKKKEGKRCGGSFISKNFKCRDKEGQAVRDKRVKDKIRERNNRARRTVALAVAAPATIALGVGLLLGGTIQEAGAGQSLNRSGSPERARARDNAKAVAEANRRIDEGGISGEALKIARDVAKVAGEGGPQLLTVDPLINATTWKAHSGSTMSVGSVDGATYIFETSDGGKTDDGTPAYEFSYNSSRIPRSKEELRKINLFGERLLEQHLGRIEGDAFISVNPKNSSGVIKGPQSRYVSRGFQPVSESDPRVWIEKKNGRIRRYESEEERNRLLEKISEIDKNKPGT